MSTQPEAPWFDDAADPALLILHARLRGIRNLARHVYVDRNAAGMPPTHRASIKTATREHYRAVIRHARAARVALLAGDIQRYELMLERARSELFFVAQLFRQPFLAARGISSSKLTATTKLPRPDRKSPLRARIITLMGTHKRSGTEFKRFMDSWIDERDGIDGVTAALIPKGDDAGKYAISDHNAISDVVAPYAWATLLKMYSESA